MIYFQSEKRYNLILFFVLIIIFLTSFYSSSFSSILTKGFPAPTFTLETIGKEMVNLKDFKEKQTLLVLYFYSPNSQDSLRGIEELDKYFKNHVTEEKYEILLVNTQKNLGEEDIALIKKYLDDSEIIFPVLLDEQNEVVKLYNIENLPTAIFLDKNLLVKRVYPGLTSAQQTLIFQYISYLLGSTEKDILKKQKEDEDKELPACCRPKSLNL